MNEESLRAVGWTAVTGTGFTAQLGTIWLRGAASQRTIGFLALPQHGNNSPDGVHGGALMTFADIALGFGAADALGGKNLVTAQLQLQFVAGGRTGEFITCTPELVRRTRRLIFMRGLILAGERTLASTEGIWSVLEARTDAT